jgi:hypothetical protein
MIPKACRRVAELDFPIARLLRVGVTICMRHRTLELIWDEDAIQKL